MTFKDMVLLSTNESKAYCDNVYRHLRDLAGRDIRRVHVRGTYFDDDEIKAQSQESIRNKRIYNFHHFVGYDGMQPDPNIGWMKLYIIDDSIRNSSVSQINHILPYIPYGRGERMDVPRAPIPARRLLRQLAVPDSEIPLRVVTFDLHAAAVQGFVNYHLDNLFAQDLFLESRFVKGILEDVAVVGVNGRADLTEDEIGNLNKDMAVLSPDAGGIVRARGFAKTLRKSGVDTNIAMIDKRRSVDGSPEVMRIIGEDYLSGRNVIIVDDILGTGNTLLRAYAAMQRYGPKSVVACGIHGVLRGKKTSPEKLLQESGMKVVITDTIPKTQEYLRANSEWLDVVSTAELTAKALYEIQIPDGSVSKLFSNGDNKLIPDDFTGIAGN